MNKFLTTLHGAVLGAIIGTALGLFVGDLAIRIFDISCFEGACGFAVVFLYMPAGFLIGAILGGIIFYNQIWTNTYIRAGLHVLAAVLLVWLAIQIFTE